MGVTGIGRLPIRVRLTVWYAAALAVAMLILSTVTYVSMRQTLYADLDGDLRQNTLALAERLDHEFQEGESARDASASLVRKSLFKNLLLEVHADDGSIVASSDRLDGLRLVEGLDVSAAPRLRTGISRYRITASPLDSAGVELAAVGVQHPADGRVYVLAAGAGRSGVETALGAMRQPALLLVPLLLLLAVTGGWLLAGRALSPVAEMADQARRMSADRFGNRLVVANPDDEFGALAKTFNELLDRLQAAFERTTQFMADASHEVRTPIGVIRSGAAVALTPPVSLDECVETLEIVADQTASMSRLVDDMFFLARADAGARDVDARERVDVNGLVAACLRTAAPLAAERRVELGRLDLPVFEATCIGDRSRLEQMLTNLIVNGIYHVRPGDSVQVGVRPGTDSKAGLLSIEVRDNGPGIPAEHRETVFERFRRLDASRSRDTGGSGLGLPIARWIAESHGGSLVLTEAAGGGCVFTVTLPAAVHPGISPVTDHFA